MILTPLIWTAATRRDFAGHGLTLRNFKSHGHVALTCLVPYALARTLLGAVPWGDRLTYTLVSVTLALAVLLVFAVLLRREQLPSPLTTLACLVLVDGPERIGAALSALVFYALFLGPGEEILFRGFIQSHLNAAFGGPFRFFGAAWGWGAIGSSLLFGAMHLANLPPCTTDTGNRSGGRGCPRRSGDCASHFFVRRPAAWLLRPFFTECLRDSPGQCLVAEPEPCGKQSRLVPQSRRV